MEMELLKFLRSSSKPTKTGSLTSKKIMRRISNSLSNSRNKNNKKRSKRNRRRINPRSKSKKIRLRFSCLTYPR